MEPTPMTDPIMQRVKPILERRSSGRFPIERDARYKIVEGKAVILGMGKTVDISSSGIRFTTESPLQAGRRLELSVSWPAQLNNGCPLKLVALGRVVRCDSKTASLAIEKYEFRTQGRNSSNGAA
jgi:hypothetical protein